MSLDYIRGIVSGKKARYVDPDHAVDLDLVYVTDRIIIMGWPASGWAGTYRNKKSDVLQFLDKRHEGKYWVWNLCPLYENAYSSASMHDRVSRYPFPDHHPPPLQLLPLAVREMTGWLAGESDRIAIIHCKAGKGRSGTLLCSYMLSLAELPGPPGMELSYSKPDRAKLAGRERKGEGWIAVGHGNEISEIQVSSEPETEGGLAVPSQLSRTASSATTISATDSSASIQVDSYQPIDIGDETPITSSGQYDRRDGKVDSVFKLHSSRRMKPSSTGRGVSIPSQRRWCRYVNLVFSQRAPACYHDPASKIRIKSITLFLHPPTGWQKPIAKLVIGGDGGQGKAWVSIARYDDEYVKELAAKGDVSGSEAAITWGGVGGEGKYDTHKMFRSCGKLTAVDPPSGIETTDDLVAHHVVPTSDLVLERGREFRMKFHLGSLPLGWAWMIPAFHLPEPVHAQTHTLRFPKSQIDFAIGPGAAIHHIDVCVEEVPKEQGASTAPLMSEREEEEAGMDDGKGEKVKEDGE
ncbi:uncharacterized protein MKK02DRAFT_27644 [Dioszegia hungarica]|uniref:phosphatidylinositol-3,4,5-trisphosphate 3-phosphatase n=1 Tax=Dioszegia hungarica TaxID=4972 RepID=A0AA38H8Z8_9TREE|nr:uncharacterized protein MKK02DRAFT_27644 [Dioszegia hungarica]KAI9636172.1 hypothetical protein MKK02DRAFT_27644 [Dioszegia hungarica]